MPDSMTFRVEPADVNARLDLFLHGQLPQYSRSRLQAWIKEGRVRVDGGPSRPSRLLRGAETIEVEPMELRPLRAFAEELPIEILYEDEDVVAVNKPAGMVVHAGAGTHSGTLVNALLHHLGKLSSVSGDLRPGIVHRLDKHTSGVILAARTDAAHRALAAQFAGRKIEKVYLALVHGRIGPDSGRIEKPIARDPKRRIRMSARLGRGRSAITQYRVLQRFERFSFLEVRISTGRTHQIRVHLSSIGHPVVGDRLYGAPGRTEGLPALTRYFLHAHHIGFQSPSTGRHITVVAPLPSEMELWMEDL